MNDPKTPLIGLLQSAPAGVDKVYLPPGDFKDGDVQRHASAVKPAVIAQAAEYYSSDDSLHNDRVPEQTIASERPIHRIMIWMAAQGANAREIAKQTNYSVESVRLVLRQPWARARLVQILKETGQDEVKYFLTHEVAPLLEVLRAVRDDEKARGADRISASKEILDRCLGKSVAKIETDNTTRNVPADLQRLESELADVRKQLDEHGSGRN